MKISYSSLTLLWILLLFICACHRAPVYKGLWSNISATIQGITRGNNGFDESVVHIMMSVNEKMLIGLPALIQSVLTNTKMPVRFYFMWCEDNGSMLKQYLSCFDIDKFNLDDVVVEQNAKDFLTPEFGIYADAIRKVHSSLGNCADIMRLQAHRMFPHVDKAIWLDVDMIVQGDIGELWNSTLHDEWIMSAKRLNLPENQGTYIKFLKESEVTNKTLELYKQRHGKPLNIHSYAFNNAVSLMNLKKWRSEDDYLQKEYKYWMTAAQKLQKYSGRPFWFVSSQGMMWMVFREEVSTFPYMDWHCDGLGWKLREKVSFERAEKAKLLHWNGELKPWLDSSGVHYPLWSKHQPTECHGAGICTRLMNASADRTFYKCVTD